jgi:lipopolysaccharide biosynthesis glycosyltransferase
MIFVDSDMVVNADLKELDEIDLGDNLIAAVQDACFSVFYDHPDPKIEASYDIKEYLDDINLENPQDVFNAGLTVINLAEFRKTFATSMVLGLANVKPLPYADQDVLNIMCHGRVHFLPHAWNYRVDVLVNNINLRAITSLYNRLRDNYKIAHYAGSAKPWNTTNLPTEEAFWHYARRSPFYIAIFKRMLWEQSTNISYSMLGMQPKKSRKLLEKFMPNGTWVRKVMEKLFPLGSFQRIAVKKVINFIFRS